MTERFLLLRIFWFVLDQVHFVELFIYRKHGIKQLHINQIEMESKVGIGILYFNYLAPISKAIIFRAMMTII